MTSTDTGPRKGAVIDLFAGPGGWSEGLRRFLGVRDIGLEWDTSACKTRRAAGHLTIQTDVAAYPTRHMAHLIRGLIASPPCTLFSSAGKGTGRRVLDLLADGIRRLFRGDDCRDEIRQAVYPVALAERQAANAKKASEKQIKPEKVEAIAREDAFCAVLVLEPARWIAELLAADGILEWVCLEQVPAVLPLWEVYVEELRELGWSAWAGKLIAADYGVPQTRERAILIASKVRTVQVPEPTHRNPKKDDALAELGIESLFAPELPRWVSMADALGLVADQIVNTRGNRKTSGGNEFSADGPSWALTEKTRSWVLRNGNQPRAAVRRTDEPAPTMTFGNNAARVEWVLQSRRDSENFKAAHGERENRSVDERAPTFTGEAHRWAWGLRNNTNANASVRTLDEPTGTLFFGHRLNNVSWVSTEPGEEAQAVRITAQEAAVIQSFPPDYPWRGSRTKQFEQIGNAVPPRLAAHVVSAATGIPLTTARPAPALTTA
jgi:DNA (cytosine-5)-methyltransferase 1